MTKLKNTKKGMAKKALSISLVAAMLATSNVPVWAAEDLFSDGSTAVEAPVVEESAAGVETFSSEPAEETSSPAVLASTTSGNEYTATVTAFKYGTDAVENNSVVWDNKNLTTTLTVTANAAIEGTTLKAVWKAGNDVITEPADLKANGDGTYTLDCYHEVTKDDANKSLSLYVYAEKADGTHAWTYTSDSVSVQAKDVNDVVTASATDVSYDGEINQATPSIAAKSGSLPAELDTLDDYTIGYTGDQVNVTGEDIVITLKPKSTAYSGTLTTTYKITALDLTGASFGTWLEAKFKNTTLKYNGSNNGLVKVKASDIELIDKKSKVDLSNYLAVDKIGT